VVTSAQLKEAALVAPGVPVRRWAEQAVMFGAVVLWLRRSMSVATTRCRQPTLLHVRHDGVGLEPNPGGYVTRYLSGRGTPSSASAYTAAMCNSTMA